MPRSPFNAIAIPAAPQDERRLCKARSDSMRQWSGSGLLWVKARMQKNMQQMYCICSHPVWGAPLNLIFKSLVAVARSVRLCAHLVTATGWPCSFGANVLRCTWARRCFWRLIRRTPELCIFYAGGADRIAFGKYAGPAGAQNRSIFRRSERRSRRNIGWCHKPSNALVVAAGRGGRMDQHGCQGRL